MNNHAPEDVPGSLSEHLRKEFKGGLGATGKFRGGKLSENDEGEIKFGVTTYKNEVIVEFGTLVKWVGLTKESAHRFADMIRRRADELPD